MASDDSTGTPELSAATTAEEMTRISAAGFDGVIGLQYTDVGPDLVRARWTVGPTLHQPFGILHGGVLCSVVESLASVAGATWLGERGRVVGVNNNTDFLRAARDGDLFGEATPIHRGRSQQLWQVHITDSADRLVARGQVRLQNLANTPPTV